MSKLDDVRAALAAELEAQKEQPDNPVIAGSVAALESQLAELEAAAEEQPVHVPEAPPPVEPPPALPPEAPPEPPLPLEVPTARPPEAPILPPPQHAPPVEYIDPRAIQPAPADHPSRLPPAARPHGLVPGNYRA